MTIPADYDTLARAFQRHLRTEGKSPKTLETYGEAVAQLRAYLATLDDSVPLVSDIAKHHVAGYLDHLEDTGRSATTRNNRHRSLQAWFKFLISEEEIDRSPLATLKAPKPDDQPVPVLTPETIAAVLATCGKGRGRSFEDIRDEALIRFMAETGTRAGEVLGMTVEKVDLDTDLVLVKGKGGKVRPVHVGDKAAKAMERYVRARARHPKAVVVPEAFWLSRLGALGKTGLRLMLNRRCAAAGVPNINPHAFRHTFAHEWMAADGSETNLMKLGGWSSRAMLQRYGASAATERALEAHRRMRLGDAY